MSGAPANASTLSDLRLRDMDGETELAAAEAVAGARTRPETVTAVLAALVDSVGGRPATRERMRSLRSAEREWLLQRAVSCIHPGMRWFEARCVQCGEPYDLSIDLSRPVYRAPEGGASTVTVETSLGTRSFAVPTGEHEERFASIGSGDPRRAFAALCGLAEDASGEARQFDEHDLELIDEAMEAESPDIADTVSARCPSCGAETSARLDPLRFALPQEDAILREIHLIARGYGWALADILRLKARQRALCAGMIARERREGWAGRRRQP